MIPIPANRTLSCWSHRCPKYIGDVYTLPSGRNCDLCGAREPVDAEPCAACGRADGLGAFFSGYTPSGWGSVYVIGCLCCTETAAAFVQHTGMKEMSFEMAYSAWNARQQYLKERA